MSSGKEMKTFNEITVIDKSHSQTTLATILKQTSRAFTLIRDTGISAAVDATHYSSTE